MFTEKPCIVQGLCSPGDRLTQSAQGEARQTSTPRVACMLLFWGPCTFAVCCAPVGMALRTWKIPILVSTKHHSPEKAKYGAIQIQFLIFCSFLRRRSFWQGQHSSAWKKDGTEAASHFRFIPKIRWSLWSPACLFFFTGRTQCFFSQQLRGLFWEWEGTEVKCHSFNGKLPRLSLLGICDVFACLENICHTLPCGIEARLSNAE